MGTFPLNSVLIKKTIPVVLKKWEALPAFFTIPPFSGLSSEYIINIFAELGTLSSPHIYQLCCGCGFFSSKVRFGFGSGKICGSGPIFLKGKNLTLFFTSAFSYQFISNSDEGCCQIRILDLWLGYFYGFRSDSDQELAHFPPGATTLLPSPFRSLHLFAHSSILGNSWVNSRWQMWALLASDIGEINNFLTHIKPWSKGETEQNMTISRSENWRRDSQ